MKPHSLVDVSIAQLKRAIAIKEEIVSLEVELAKLLGAAEKATRTRKSKLSVLSVRNAGVSKRKRRKMSAKTRARMAAAAKTRWAKAKAAGKNSL